MDDYFGWFDPAGWLSDIGSLISEGIGILAEPINALGQGFNNFVNGIGDFFTNLISSLGNWFEDIGQWFANLGNSIGQWFTDLGNSIGQWFTNLIDDIQGIATSIEEWFSELFGALGEILNYLNPMHENFFLKIAFIPSEGYFEDFASDIKTSFDGKFTFISDIGNILGSIFGGVFDTDPEPPEFNITLPGGKWGEGSVKVIDFSIFEDYRPFILNFIRVLLWIPFLIKLYKRLPSLVYQ